jgi:hypothetical protein
MTDYIVDTANFYMLVRMNGSSGLEVLQALIDAGQDRYH